MYGTDHACDTVLQHRNDIASEVDPVKCLKHTDNGIDDLRHIGNKCRYCLYEPHPKRYDNFQACRQQLWGIVVNQPCNISYNLRHIFDQRGQAVGDALSKVEQQVNTGVNDISKIGAQCFRKLQYHGQRLCQKVGDALRQPCTQALQHLRADRYHLEHKRRQNIADCREQIACQKGGYSLCKALQCRADVAAKR